MNFQTILMPKMILENFLSQKITHFDHFYLKYDLDYKMEKFTFSSDVKVDIIKSSPPYQILEN